MPAKLNGYDEVRNGNGTHQYQTITSIKRYQTITSINDVVGWLLLLVVVIGVGSR